MEIDKVLEDVSTAYSIPLSDLKTRIGGKYAEDQPPKRRGRKKKQKEEFIEVEEYVYEDTTYLVDEQNYVYTFNLEAPHLIGERFVDGTIKFFHQRRLE